MESTVVYNTGCWLIHIKNRESQLWCSWTWVNGEEKVTMALFLSCCPQRNHRFIEISLSRNFLRTFIAKELTQSLS